MRYIKLFENFDQNSGELKQMASTVFDFLPFDTEINNPMNSSIPGSLDGDGVVESVFDSKLDKVTETLDIDPTSINFGDYGKGMDTLGRFGVLGDE